MNNDFKELQNKWNNNKKNIESSADSFEDLNKIIRKKEKENFLFYYGTINTLSITLIVVFLFFNYAAPVKEVLSRLGVGLMLFGLVIRIVIEVISIYKAKQINSIDNVLKTTENSILFHRFRKTIHGVYTPIIIALYTIGFYMITPEFNVYMELWYLLLIDISYVFIAFVLFVIIRKGVKKEMQELIEIIKLKNEIIEE